MHIIKLADQRHGMSQLNSKASLLFTQLARLNTHAVINELTDALDFKKKIDVLFRFNELVKLIYIYIYIFFPHQQSQIMDYIIYKMSHKK